MKKITLSKRNKILLIAFAAAVLIGLIFAIVNFTVNDAPRTSASVNILLTYENASAGMDPEGYYLYADSFITDELIEKALESQGLSGKYDIAKVRKSLSVVGAYPENMLKKITSFDSLADISISREQTKSIYFPTRYSLVLYDDFDSSISKAKLDGLLGAIRDEYVKAFNKKYSSVLDRTQLNKVLVPENYDYVYALDIYTANIKSIRNYAQLLNSRHEEFLYEGVSFRDIVLKCDNIIKNDISRIDSNISLNALSNNVQMLKCYYEYKIRMLNLSLDSYNKNLQTISNAVSSFEKDATLYLSSGDSITKIDGNSSETYDELVAKQLTISAEIASANRTLSDCRRRLNTLTSSSKTGPEALLQNDLAMLKNNVESLESSLNKLVGAYNEKYIDGKLLKSSEVTHTSSSVFSGVFVVELVKCCGPFCALVVLAAAVLWFLDELKRSKNKA